MHIRTSELIFLSRKMGKLTPGFEANCLIIEAPHQKYSSPRQHPFQDEGRQGAEINSPHCAAGKFVATEEDGETLTHGLRLTAS